jgi:two-component sensor histidine kinase
LQLVWRESGGPPVMAPQTLGFGSRLLEKGLARELCGHVCLDFAVDGLVCRIDMPLPEGD